MAGLEGHVLDRYELRQLAGRGGMADVYRGFDTRFQRDVAVKVFKREDEELLQRFMREARLMASLHNPHLMPVFDTGMDDVDGIPYYYIVMPFMDDGTLRSRIRRGPLPLTDACRFLREIADALDYIHRKGIIHRDIKASNVLLDADGNCYLADFGIARSNSDVTQLTSTGNVLGTVDYVAPELFEPNYRADARSDFYSLGILLYEMVTGRLPFSAENQIAVVTMHMTKPPPLPSSIIQNLPPQVELVLLRSLEKKPDLRYASAIEFADAFCQAINTPGAISTIGNPATPVWRQEDGPVQSVPLVLPRTTPVAPQQPPTRRTTRIINEPAYVPPASRSTQTFRPPPSPTRTRARIVTVIALIILLAVIGPVIYILLGNSLPWTKSASGTGGSTQTATSASVSPTKGVSPTTTPNHTATAQAFAHATQQAQHATATAIAGVTVTAQAHASATAGVIQTATTGTATYHDALNDANNAVTQQEQWDTNANCVFASDGYHIKKGTSILNEGQLQGCLEKGNRYSNMTLSVDMTIVSGHSGGVFFRVSTKALGAYAGYLFEVDNTGRYKISKSSNFSTGTGDATLQDWTPSSALKVSAKNTLQFIAHGNTLSFYANGTYLTTVQDKENTFTDGYIALLASTVTGGEDADIVYSNLSVYAAS